MRLKRSLAGLLAALVAVSPLSAADIGRGGRTAPSGVVLPEAAGPSARLSAAPAATLAPAPPALPAAALPALAPPAAVVQAVLKDPPSLRSGAAPAAAVAASPKAASQLTSAAAATPADSPVSAGVEASAAALSAAFDALAPRAEAPPAAASKCPFHRLLGLKGGEASPHAGPATPAPAVAARKPSLLKFSLRAVFASTARHWWAVVTGRARAADAQAPPKVGLLSLARLALAHVSNPVRGLEALHARYGDTARFQSPTGHRAYFLSDPAAVQRVLMNTDKVADSGFEKSELGIGGIAQLTGRGTIFLGLRERWRHRAALMRGFMLPKAIHTEDMAGRVGALVDAGLDDLARRVDAAGPEGADVKVADEMSALTMRVILGILFSYDAPPSDIFDEVGPAFAEVTRTVPAESLNPTTIRLSDLPLVYPRRRQLKKAYAVLDAFAGKILAAGRARREPKGDLLDALLSAVGEDGRPLTDSEIKNEILTLVLAGHETTSSTLTWGLSSLHGRPESLARLRAEIARGPKDPAMSDLKSGYVYLDQVIRETLRLYTPAYVLFRKASRDVVVPTSRGPVSIPKGSEVFLSTYVTHRRPGQWDATGYGAAGFFPERFDEAGLAARGLRPLDVLTFAFGHGPRSCLGQALSLLETQLIMIRLLQRFELTPRGGSETLVSDIGVRRADGFPALLRRR